MAARKAAIASLCLFALLLGGERSYGREIIDMAGRHVVVPDIIRRVYVAHDPPALFMTALAPDLMIGTPFSRNGASNALFPPSVRRLPVVGGSMRINPEALLSMQVDVAVVWNIRGQSDTYAAQLQAMGIPVVMVDASPFSHYPAAFRFLGNLLHREERADRLARALEDGWAHLKAQLAAIPQERRLRVYYADAPDGLKSQCTGAFRGETVELAGGINVMPCTGPDGMTASVSTNLETLLKTDPDVVFARTHAIAANLAKNPGWRALRAVREGRLYAPPELPVNWVERPHSHLKLLAMEWLANKLYPDDVPFDFTRDVRAFFLLFYDMELSDDDIARLRS